VRVGATVSSSHVTFFDLEEVVVDSWDSKMGAGAVSSNLHLLPVWELHEMYFQQNMPFLDLVQV